jgi:hypothetical protein
MPVKYFCICPLLLCTLFILIDAYLQGTEAGRNEEKRIIREKLRDNILKATQAAEENFALSRIKNINLLAIHLRAENVSSFTALLVADLKEYVSDKFKEIYILANEIKNKVQRENFDINFSFTHNSPKPVEELLAADGFFLRYEKKH